MNNLDLQYQALLQDILTNGTLKKDRTGTGTISVFGRTIRHKMSEGFPLLTTKKMATKSIITELLWFLRGETNIRQLNEQKCTIWNGDAYKKYLKNTDMPIKWLFNKSGIEPCEGDDFYRHYTEKEFIKKILEDQEFAQVYGDLGPIYGRQWRHWEGPKDISIRDGQYPNGEFKWRYEKEHVDQILNLVNDLKNNPDSRRLMVNAWNVPQISQMTLPPCHYGFQLYTRELSTRERVEWYNARNRYKVHEDFMDNIISHEKIDDVLGKNRPIPKRAISLMWQQRSVDTFLGLPFNIASYGLLLSILAEEVNMVPDELIGNLGDTHLYLNHIDQAKEQIGRDLTLEERIELASKDKAFDPGDFGVGQQVDDERCHLVCDSYMVPRRTRVPYPLPKLYINTEFWNPEGVLDGSGYDAIIHEMKVEDFIIENYVSHPKIDAPLSN